MKGVSSSYFKGSSVKVKVLLIFGGLVLILVPSICIPLLLKTESVTDTSNGSSSSSSLMPTTGGPKGTTTIGSSRVIMRLASAISDAPFLSDLQKSKLHDIIKRNDDLDDGLNVGLNGKEAKYRDFQQRFLKESRFIIGDMTHLPCVKSMFYESLLGLVGVNADRDNVKVNSLLEGYLKLMQETFLENIFLHVSSNKL